MIIVMICFGFHDTFGISKPKIWLKMKNDRNSIFISTKIAMAPRKGRTLITINVYDLVDFNEYLLPLGLGVFHSGVEFGSDEYTFANEAGIFSSGTPRSAEGATYRESIELGYFEGSVADARSIVHSLHMEFPPGSYHLVNQNCNSFANALCLRLLERPIPGYINRLAFMGSFCSCFFPSDMGQQAPVDQSKGSQYQYKKPITTQARRAFTGSGQTLGGGGSSSDIADRREKVRQAALRRLEERQQQQVE